MNAEDRGAIIAGVMVITVVIVILSYLQYRRYCAKRSAPKVITQA